MFGKYLSVILIGLLLNLTCYPTAAAKAENDGEFAGKVKTNVAKLGTGRNAKIKVKLKDGSKLKGYVSELKDSSFVVVNEKSGTETEVEFVQVKQVKGQNYSNGEKIFFRASIIIGVLLLYGYLLSRSSDY